MCNTYLKLFIIWFLKSNEESSWIFQIQVFFVTMVTVSVIFSFCWLLTDQANFAAIVGNVLALLEKIALSYLIK